ncbi:hypothetical protein ACFV9E_42150, partial [Streptomyces sp. NPDC059835]
MTVEAAGPNLAAIDGAQITRPALFTGGGLDVLACPTGAIKAFGSTLAGLVTSHLLDGRGRRIQQERPAEANRIPAAWTASPPPGPASAGPTPILTRESVPRRVC